MGFKHDSEKGMLSKWICLDVFRQDGFYDILEEA